jgi:rhodanese-related sulfurtransferase
MRQYGITNVSALEGGFDAWKAGGNPVKAGG